ncbi:squalene synthase HpnC [Kribbella sp. VKM Ac-2569]|uniref:squalene synthase HpnC n=1 Tax=Kribbella sp. VKM Ac-2569 TaxID=2512220 RepID=UPI00102B4849|nr:squalene synthase HpnC [Kribbella sp. VKM Ac-2569]
MASSRDRPPGPSSPTGEEAFRIRENAENFPVALRFLPRRYRDHLHAIYGYARMVDEIGDAFTGDRTARLHELATDLGTIWTRGQPSNAVLRRLARTVHDRAMSAEPFERLIEANLQDQVVSRYETFEDLRRYCTLSADPVGRMVLEVFGQATPETVARSDQVCTALQLLEHWQDVGEDRRAGRVYLPQEELRRYGVGEHELDRGSASPQLRALMRFEIERAAGMLGEGMAIVRQLQGWGRISVAGFIAGGQATVSALRQTDGDVLGQSAQPSRVATAARILGLLAARRPVR